MKRKHYPVNPSDFEELRAHGYKVWRFSPVHLRISHPDYITCVDVWPGTRKIWVKDSAVKSNSYTDLVSEVNTIFAKELV